MVYPMFLYSLLLIAVVPLGIQPQAAELSPTVSVANSNIDLTSQGSGDWVHWGLDTPSSVNRKASVTAQIGSITTLGSNPKRFQASGNSRSTYAWNDGTPTAATSTTAGIYFRGTGNGFEFSVPADTTARTLRVHLGGYQARGQIEVSLSDGSVVPFVTTVEDLGGAFDRTLSVTYSAASAGETLTVRYFMLTGSNVTLQAASLQGSVGNAAPVLGPIGNKTATVGIELSFDVQATDIDGPAPLVLTHSSLPSGASFTPDAGTPGRGTFSWTPANGDLPGPYNVTFTATEDNGLGESDEETIQISVVPASGGGGSLLPTVNGTSSLVNLTADGSDDWVHWGLVTPTSVNRKAGGGSQISGITTLGSNARRFEASANARATYDWSDGTPNGSESTTAGIFFRGNGNGFQFTAPADTTTRTLQVHLGGYQARGQIEVSLSDASAPAFVTTVEDLNGAFDRSVTVSYNAASAGQSLTVRYSMLTGSNVTLQAATLQGGGAANAAPVLSPIGNQAATVGSELSFVVQATDNDGPAPLLLTHSTLPPGATFVPDSGTPGRGTFRWTPSSGDLPGPYSLTFTATENNGLGKFAQETVQISVSPDSGGNGSLSPSVGNAASTIDLTAQGSADWVHWGLSTASSVNRKSGVTPQIGTITTLGSSARRFQASGNSRSTYNWTDGAPQGSASTKAGIYFRGNGNGFEFTVPADTTSRTLRVHLGGYQARGEIEVTMSDGSVSPYVTTVEDLNGAFDRTLSISYNAASAGQTLTVRYSKLTGSNVTLQAATLQGGGGTGLGLPFSDNFGGGNSNGWTFVNQTPTAASWNFAGGELRQTAIVESVDSFEESYHLGTYSWLPSGVSLSDYIFSVDISRTNVSRPESLGILFRYRDPDNFYRLTINARQGFMRLEKREDAVYFTLAVNAFGLDPGSSFNLLADLSGADIRVSVDGTPVLAASDTAHASGSIGMFTQSPATFDNVLVAPAATDSDVRIAQPTNLTVIPGSSVNVSAVVRNLPAGGSVVFSMPGRPDAVRNGPPWSATFNGLSEGETTVTARLRNAGSSTIDQHVVDIAVDGMYAVAIGDSITNGDIDSFASDNDDAQRVSSDRAYASTLAALLEALPPTESIIFNEGIGGDTAADNDSTRLQSIIERHPNRSHAMVEFGTNDALAGVGQNAFRNNMQSIANRLGTPGMTTYVATLPPILGGSNPLNSGDNSRISGYNSSIENDITGVMPGADLWAFLAPDDTGDGVADRIRIDLYADDFHPNALGHSVIAALWYNVLLGDSTGTAITPYFLDSISRSDYRQNLLEAGDTYLVDAGDTVESIPAILSNAVWIMTGQANAGSTQNNFMSFDTPRAATVYVAYDSNASSLPTWLNPGTSSFQATGLTVVTSQTDYTLYSRVVPAGAVTLGGNAAAGANGATDMYIVAIRPN